uniref:Uncharacterized protein n=1 Tax=viral metagenome TaxID=1070528 RepID=A0A6H1ZDU1_9ZZZZ
MNKEKYEIKKIKRDGVEIVKFKCPKCGEWADIDDDQYNGRVSIFHDTPKCGFHETINLKTK